jgi:hypothetical protein
VSNAQPAPVRAGPGAAAPPSSPSPGLDPTLFRQACFPVTTELGHRKGLGLISPEDKARGLTKLSLNSLGQAQRPYARGTVRKREGGLYFARQRLSRGDCAGRRLPLWHRQCSFRTDAAGRRHEFFRFPDQRHLLTFVLITSHR